MLTIDLEPELETTLINLAEQEHISLNDIFKQFAKSYIQQKQAPELLTDIIKDLPEFPSFANKDPLALQKAMRDEWD